MADSPPPPEAPTAAPVGAVGVCAAAAAEVGALSQRLGRHVAAFSRGGRADAADADRDREALGALHEAGVELVGAYADVLGGAATAVEARHPSLWEGAAPQLRLVAQLRSARRLCHLLGHMREDFGPTSPRR